MTAVAILFVIGLVLLAVEVFVPSGLVGAVGGLFFIGGVVEAFREFGGGGGAIALVVALGVAGVMLYLEFAVFPRTRFARSLSMTDTVAGRSQPAVADPAVVLGREVTAVTTLSPSGYVELDGRRYEAFCQSGHVPAGARLRVTDLDTFRLVVTLIKQSS